MHVPYRGEASALTDLLGGQIQFLLVTGAAKPYVDSGKLLILATTGAERWSIFPKAPTLKEIGLAPDLVANGWLGFIAPAGVPKEVVDKLNAAFVKALNQASVEKVLVNQGYSVVASKPEELTSLVQGETVRFGKIIKAGKIKFE